MRKGEKGKKTVLKVFLPFVLKIIASGLFAITGFLTGNLYVAIFFILVTLYLSYPVYNPNVKLVFIDTKGYDKYLKADAENFMQNYKSMQGEPGIFSYTEAGFSIGPEGKAEHYLWNDISSMIGYKRDNFTTDCICLDVFCDNNRQIHINEEIKGWSMFLNKSNEQFPQINKIWTIDIASPAFKTNLTLVYDREGRTLEEVMKAKPIPALPSGKGAKS